MRSRQLACLYLAVGAHPYSRWRTGVGRWCRTSLLESMLLMDFRPRAGSSRCVPRSRRQQSPTIAPMGVFPRPTPLQSRPAEVRFSQVRALRHLAPDLPDRPAFAICAPAATGANSTCWPRAHPQRTVARVDRDTQRGRCPADPSQHHGDVGRRTWRISSWPDSRSPDLAPSRSSTPCTLGPLPAARGDTPTATRGSHTRRSATRSSSTTPRITRCTRAMWL